MGRRATGWYRNAAHSGLHSESLSGRQEPYQSVSVFTSACCFPVPRPSEVEDVTYSEEDVAVLETAQVQIGLR